jgi:hypothetical protein
MICALADTNLSVLPAVVSLQPEFSSEVERSALKMSS